MDVPDIDLGYARNLVKQAEDFNARGLHIDATERARAALRDLRSVWPEYYDLMQKAGIALLHSAGF